MSLRKNLAAATVLMLIGASVLVTASPATAADHVVQTTYYASPAGSGSTCSSASPCSLTGARDKVRTVNTNMTGDIVVLLKGGTYPIASTFTLTESATIHDSGTNGFDIIYRNAPGETPVLSGGETITGFTVHDAAKNIHRAPVSASLETRQLYVGGQRAIRARSTGNPAFTLTSTGYTVPSSGVYSGMAGWGAVSDIEVVTTMSWKQARYSVGSITGTAMTMDAAGWNDGNTQPSTASRSMAWIENAYELLDTEGEWYLDRGANWMYYIPRAGENLATAPVVAGRTEGLVAVSGSAATPIHNVSFDGLTFAHDSWTLPNTAAGYPDFQGGAVYRGSGDWWNNSTMTPAGVTFTVARDVTVKNNTFTHMANAALAFGAGSQRNTIDRNTFTDISGNGINVGGIDIADHHPTNPQLITRDNTVSRNTITKVGVEYGDNLGIFLGYTRGSDVRNNVLHDLPYSAISMGWGWGYIDTLGAPVAGNNVVRGNLVYDFMKERQDGGAIYTLGSQLGSQIVDNYTYGAQHIFGGLYLDNGSAGITVKNNVVSNEAASSNQWALVNTSAGGYWNPHDTLVTQNFFRAGMVASPGGGSNVVTANTSVSGAWPATAQAVIDNAGVSGVAVTAVVPGEPALSTGKPATASSTFSATYDAGKAVDGDPSTRWAQGSGLPDPSWLRVDLGAQYQLSSTTTVPYLHTGKALKYKIEYSVDGSTWSTFVDRTATWTVPGTDAPSSAATGRHVRITLTGTQGQGGSINEFKVYGTPVPPLSQGKTATASSIYSGSYDASKAVDGSAATRWAQGSDLPDPSWLQVDLGSAQSIGRTETLAYLPSASGVKYKIEYSTNGTTWSMFADRTAAFVTPGTDTVPTAVTARYVRITLTGTQGQGGSLYEFKVYG
jgi:hypothetical protein